MSTLRSTTISGAGWSAAEGVAGQVVSFLLFLALARLLAPVDFGLVAVANLCVMIMQSFIYQGLGQAIVQFPNLDDSHLDTIFYINLMAGGIFSVGLIGLAPAIEHWFATPGLAGVLCWLSPILLISGLTDVQNNILVRRMNFRALALRTLLSYLAGGIVGVVLALRGAGVWSLVGQQLTIAVVNLFVLWTASDWRPGFQFSLSRARILSKFGVHLLWADLVTLANRRGDQFFVGKYIGSVQVGFYAVGSRVSMLVGEVLAKSFARVTLSTLSRLQDQQARFSGAFSEILEMQSVLVFPVAIGLSLIAPEVIALCFGSKWSQSIPVMQALLLACPFEAFSGAHQSALIARGKPHWSSAITSTHALFNVIAFMVAVRWGTTAVAIAFSIRAIVLYPLELLLLKREIDLELWPILRLLLPQVLATAIMAFAVNVFRTQSGFAEDAWWRLIGSLLVGALAYILALVLLNRPILTKVKHVLRLLTARAGEV